MTRTVTADAEPSEKSPPRQKCSLSISGDDGEEGRGGRKGKKGVMGGSKVSTQWLGEFRAGTGQKGRLEEVDRELRRTRRSMRCLTEVIQAAMS